MKKTILVVLTTILAILVMVSPAFANTTESENQFFVTGKDIVGGSLPLRVQSLTTPQEFDEGSTWGRVVRLEQKTNLTFFDLGIDEDGNFFINTPQSSASSHALTIAPDGTVTIPQLAQ